MSDLETKDEPNVDVCAPQSLDADDNSTAVLKSSDGKSFTISKKAVFVSKLVSQALENDPCADEVPIPGATGSILELIIQYMCHHDGTEPPIVEKPLRSKLMKDVCKDTWDANFIDEIGNNRQQLYDLILAANYMDVKSLLHLGCAKVASLIKGQPLEKIKDILAVDQSANKTESKTEYKTESKDESKINASEVPANTQGNALSASSAPTEPDEEEGDEDEDGDEGDEGDEGDDNDDAIPNQSTDVTVHTSS